MFETRVSVAVEKRMNLFLFLSAAFASCVFPSGFCYLWGRVPGPFAVLWGFAVMLTAFFVVAPFAGRGKATLKKFHNNKFSIPLQPPSRS